ncbi:hypothetical protein Tsubulata_018754 [Turnera subulata]|uniref:Pectinesterase inhibitor domain-containing protein n=1 Tax=Turnera subulata TaxID=218843 RepID=A0A9Q0FXN1_9ROSI|nr:hypothetical protein Tsubulata_018754 [Turnera subulata]
MWHISFSTFALCLLLLEIPGGNTTDYRIDALSTIDILNRTCKRCAEESTDFSYNFCRTSLDAIPTSHIVNLHGLAVIGMELALQNATNTISSIKSLLSVETLDPFALACLQDCLELYLNATVSLIDGVAAFLSEHYSVANEKVSRVMKSSTTCEGLFAEKKGEVCPLARENYNLYQLCNLALCIIHLV